MDFAEDKALLNEKNIEIIIDIDVTTSLIYVKLHCFLLLTASYCFKYARSAYLLIPVTQQNNWSDILYIDISK